MKRVFNKWINIWNNKALFIPRVIVWLILVAVVPIILINQKFVLLSRDTGGIDFNAWGLIALIVVSIGIYVLLGYVINAFEYSFVIQCLNGFRKCLIWIGLAYLGCVCINNNIEKIQYILQWSFVSVACAIIINPLPRWSYKTKYKRVKEELK